MLKNTTFYARSTGARRADSDVDGSFTAPTDGDSDRVARSLAGFSASHAPPT
jgi:hypothetical protein